MWQERINAFYCTADQQVYYSTLLPEALPTVRQNKWTADIDGTARVWSCLAGPNGHLISRTPSVRTPVTRDQLAIRATA